MRAEYTIINVPKFINSTLLHVRHVTCPTPAAYNDDVKIVDGQVYGETTYDYCAHSLLL